MQSFYLYDPRACAVLPSQDGSYRRKVRYRSVNSSRNVSSFTVCSINHFQRRTASRPKRKKKKTRLEMIAGGHERFREKNKLGDVQGCCLKVCVCPDCGVSRKLRKKCPLFSSPPPPPGSFTPAAPPPAWNWDTARHCGLFKAATHALMEEDVFNFLRSGRTSKHNNQNDYK